MYTFAMARNQKNFKLFDYTDDNGSHWSVRGEDGGAAAAVDGHAAFDVTKPIFYRQTKRRHTRSVTYMDPVTFRTIRAIVYTPAAFNAIAVGAVLAVTVAGLATTVNYTLSAKNAEKIPLAKGSRNLADS